MSGCNPKSLVLAGAITVSMVVQSQAQDVANGEHLFRNDCGICHSPQPGRNLIGPSLFNVINRHSGQLADYRYSDANRQSGLTWNLATLDRYLTAPRELVPGTKMTYPGMKDEKQRADLIAYLATLH
jgi:cytochrome c2